MNIDMQKVVTGQAEVTKRLGMSDYTYRRPADLRELVRGSVEADPKKTVFRFRRGDEFLSMSYGEFGRYIDMVGTALYDMGLQGKKIAVMGETSPEWIIAYLAAVCGNCVIVPIDKELPPENVADFINLSGVECLFYSESYAASVDRFCGLVPGVRYFVTMPAESYYPPVSVEAVEQAVGEGDCTFRAVAGRGKYLLKQDVRDYTDCVIDREKMCTLLFTSGTTGTSKGVMLSHKNIVTVAQNVLGSIRVTADEVLMSVLPIHHTYEMSHGILTALNAGCTICINDSLKHLKRNFAEYRPTIMTLVPVFLSSMYKTVWDSAAKSGLDKKLRAGIRVSNAARFVGVDLRAKLFSEVRKAFGGRLTRIICGGAPLNPDYVSHFEDLGITVIQGYGITECSPLVTVIPHKVKNAPSVGKAIDGVSLYIDKENETDEVGEILVRGDNVMLGYYENSTATEEVMTEGWFRTGDYGYLDDKGFLYITGRKKNVIISSNGKNIFPEEIEEHLDSCSLIAECVVVGRPADDGVIHVTALVYPDYDRSEKMGLSAEEINEAIKAQVAEVNKKLPIYKRIRGIEIRHTPFPKTTTKKIKRHEVQ